MAPSSYWLPSEEVRCAADSYGCLCARTRTVTLARSDRVKPEDGDMLTRLAIRGVVCFLVAFGAWNLDNVRSLASVFADHAAMTAQIFCHQVVRLQSSMPYLGLLFNGHSVCVASEPIATNATDPAQLAHSRLVRRLLRFQRRSQCSATLLRCSRPRPSSYTSLSLSPTGHVGSPGDTSAWFPTSPQTRQSSHEMHVSESGPPRKSGSRRRVGRK